MSTALPLLSPGRLAPWRWRDGLIGLLLGASLSLSLVMLRAELLQLWQAVILFWRLRLGLPVLENAIMPVASGTLLAITSAAAVLAWTWSGTWHERLWPARVMVRAMCLVQGSACAFFALAPARFPYGLGQHLQTLLWLGAEFMVAIPLMLCLGWGVLRLPWTLKLMAPLAVLLYFAVWLPHQVLLHAWLLLHASVLFMPLLFLCFGLLLDGWIFIAIYAWLASLTPRVWAQEDPI